MLLQWRGKVASVDSSFTLYELQKLDENWQFISTGAVALSQGAVPRDIKSYGVAFDNIHGVCSPFLLMTYGQSRSCNLLIFDHADGQLKTYGRFESSHSGRGGEGWGFTSSRDVLIMDGPTVVWSENGYIHLACCNPSHQSLPLTMVKGTVQLKAERNARDLLEASDGGMKIDRLWAFDGWADGSSEESDITLLLFLSVTWQGNMESVEGKVGETSQWLSLLLTWAVSADSTPQVKYLDPDSLIPSDYGCIATCIALHSSHVVNSATGGICPQSRFLVGTTYQQTVIFESGYLLYCVPLNGVPGKVVSMEVTPFSLHYYSIVSKFD